MISDLHSALDSFANSNQDFLVLTGSGRAFCFGADFEEFEDRQALPKMLEQFQSLILKLYDCKKITVACLNGFATGAGFDLALACDFRVAAEKIKLAEAYISMGLVPDGGGSFLLPHLIGGSRALEMMLTGEAISAETAFNLGLIHRQFPAAELTERTLQFVAELAAKPKTARELIKKLLKNPSPTLKDALKAERDAQMICFEDAEHQHLAAEFLKRRKKS